MKIGRVKYSLTIDDTLYVINWGRPDFPNRLRLLFRITKNFINQQQNLSKVTFSVEIKNPP
ncbi:hypothetical protein T11_9059 [Trichinella zimbabwensis]|uniref:Uncharacterized protein n=1 Tax=Trichinella zimbabwensis TaxID=268475 RepID=A0A0V1HWC2_9BILA|nr:hypothetical protein T11_9059 [Trichinella zimbabwensis]